MVRGIRLVGGIALGSAALLVLAIAFAWQPEIVAIPPPAASSFDRNLIAEGEDLAKMGNCAGCHTADPARPLAGGRGISTPFGTVFATNITPDAETGIGAWSRAAFDRAMRRGISRSGEHLYPAFPYDHFTHVGADELEALYVWLMTRPPLTSRSPVTSLDGVFAFRPLIAVWNLFHLTKGPLKPDPARSSDWNRGRALAEGLAHCGGCHTPRNRFGADDRALAYDGAMVEGWYAPPLNGRSPAVRPWTVDRLHVYLRTGLSPAHAAAAGPMGDVTRALAEVRDEDVRAIAVYFAWLMSEAPAHRLDQHDPMDRQVVAQQAHPAAATLFAGACAVCHEPGAPMMQQGRPPLAWGTPLRVDNAHDTVRIIMEGMTSPAGPTGPTMPAFADILDDGQLRELAAYLRIRFTDKPPWSDIGDAVAQARQAEGK